MKDRNTPISWSTQGTLSIHAHKHDKRPDFYKEIVDKILGKHSVALLPPSRERDHNSWVDT